jgi:exodeoxyribonuclease VII large subunit
MIIGMTKQQENASLFDEAPQGSNVPEFSVAELSQQVKKRIEGEFGHVRVKGEVTQPKLHSSGHLYLTLKDENACLAAVCWRGQVSRLKVRVEEGMEVVATGRLTTYPGQSKYQLVIEQVALAGVGALLKMLEDRKKKLAAEGLFDAGRKKPIPFLPRTIGVITSPTGAVIRDILHRLADRFPLRVLLWPVAVQGEAAAVQIASAISGFNALPEDSAIPRPDVLIVARGGGSLEDLLAFHEEIVVRAAANSRIPLISAVGHETDTTLIDFASDHRAPTPTAAAERAVPVRADLLLTVAEEGTRLMKGFARMIDQRRLLLARHAAQLAHPKALIETLSQRVDERGERLHMAATNFLHRHENRLHRLAAGLSVLPLKQKVEMGGHRLEQLAGRLKNAFGRVSERQDERVQRLGAMLESLSYQRVLQRGFVLVKGADGHAVMQAKDAPKGGDVSLVFADGSVDASIKG